MKKTGINLENVKIRNKSSILLLLRRSGGMSRKDIAEQVGLTPAAVTLLCSEMMEEGILKETGEVAEEHRAGRRKIMVDINYNWKYVLAITIERRNTYVAICNLKSEVVKQEIIRTDYDLPAEEFVKVIAQKCKDILYESGMGKADILGVGVSLPGHVNWKTGVALHKYGVFDHDINIVSLLSKELDCPVAADNNVRAFAEGESLTIPHPETENFLYIKWGPGVGAALIHEGLAYGGRKHRGIEIGHYVLANNPRKCKCGRTGCLETLLSGSAITETVREMCNPETTPQLYEIAERDPSQITEQHVVDWLDHTDMDLSKMEDEPVRELLRKSIDILARVTANAGTLLSPTRVVVFGNFMNNDGLRAAFLDKCKEYDDSFFSEETFALARHSGDVYSFGAASIAALRFFYDPITYAGAANH